MSAMSESARGKRVAIGVVVVLALVGGGWLLSRKRNQDRAAAARAEATRQAHPEPNDDGSHFVRRGPAPWTRPLGAYPSEATTAKKPIPPPRPLVRVLPDGTPLLGGKPVDPNSAEFRQVVPEPLPTQKDLDAVFARLQPVANDCFRQQKGGDKGGVLTLSLMFRGGDLPQMPSHFAVHESPAQSCLRSKLAKDGLSDGDLVMTPHGRWIWPVVHRFTIPPG